MQRTVWIGDYPSVGLAEARLRAAEFKLVLRQGIDPKAEKDKARAEEIAASVPDEPIWKGLSHASTT